MGNGPLQSVSRVANRGGNWNNGANNGVFYVNFNNDRTNANANIGGRPALPPAGYVCGAPTGIRRRRGQRGPLALPAGETAGKNRINL